MTPGSVCSTATVARSARAPISKRSRPGGRSESHLTEWVRYDEGAQNSLVRTDPDMFLELRRAAHALDIKMSAVLDEWGAREDPPRGAIDSEILSIEVIDGRLALVSLRYWNTVYDALILARVGEQWEIIAKAYTDQ